MNIRVLNNISKAGLQYFVRSHQFSATMENPDAIILRSQDLHATEINKALIAVARAGAGVNNIPVDKMTKKGVVVFNTPGANANAVKELVLGSLFSAVRNLPSAIKFATDVSDSPTLSETLEKEKKRFKGSELMGKTIGIIGLGAIGSILAEACFDLGMMTVGFDPMINNIPQLRGKLRYAKDMQDLFEGGWNCDFISLHVPLNSATKEMFDARYLSKMKQGSTLLNFSRKEIVKVSDLLAAMDSKTSVSTYITDFPCAELKKRSDVIMTPHIGASTDESEDNCASMAAQQLVSYLETGEITNSVNFPNITMQASGNRLVVINEDKPGVINHISQCISDAGANINAMSNQAKNGIAITLIDTNHVWSIEWLDRVRQLEGVLQIRQILS